MNHAMNHAAVDAVVQIHSVLAVRYGAGWARMWQGLDMEFVRADWRRVLREFEGNPAAIAYALDNLPVGARPPTVGEFAQLCAAAPRPAVRLLPREGAKPTAQQVQLLAMVRAQVKQSKVGAKQRALDGYRNLLARAEAGEVVLTPTVRRMAVEVLTGPCGRGVGDAH